MAVNLHLFLLSGLMNPTDKPLRYRINIFLEDMDKAAGHLVPRKGKPPVLEPGKAATVKIPFIGTDKESKKILVIVKTISVALMNRIASSYNYNLVVLKEGFIMKKSSMKIGLWALWYCVLSL